ncbi:MAG: hypothetical protein KIT83_19225 [Bryobacterales bacterium]|nr:hypothetical protein [Bryobacterales bacterium]
MIDWMRLLLGKARMETEPLLGVPESRRQKTYSSLGGYVFQYVYAGYRLSVQPPGKDFVFQVLSQRSSARPLIIRLTDSVVAELAHSAHRELSSREQYALAKLKLFRILDEWEPQAVGASSTWSVAELSREEACEFWNTLDL